MIKKLLCIVLVLFMLATLLSSCAVDGVDGKDGKDGIDGINGIDGKDGKDGKDGLDGQDGEDGKDGKDGKNGTNGMNGRNGTDGKSAFQLFKVEHPSYTGTEEEWLATYFGTTAEEVYAMARASVVTLVGYNYFGDKLGSGSGFFIDGRGTILTAYHVVEGKSDMTVRLSNGDDQYKITRLLAYDEERDLAILESDCTNTTPLALRADPTSLQAGEKVYSFGSSLGYLYSSLGEGVLAAPPRYQLLDEENYCTVIQYTAPISPGNSGGPILDRDGKVIGVVTYMDTRGESAYFATHISEVANISTEYRQTLLSHMQETQYYREKLGHVVAETSDLPRTNIINDVEGWLLPQNGQTVVDTVRRGEQDFYMVHSGSPDTVMTIAVLFEEGMQITLPKIYERSVDMPEVDADWNYVSVDGDMIVYTQIRKGTVIIEVDGAYDNMDCFYGLYAYWSSVAIYERFADITSITDFIPGI